MSFFKKEDPTGIDALLHSKKEEVRLSKAEVQEQLDAPVDEDWALLTIESLRLQLEKIEFAPKSAYNTDLLEMRAEVGHLSRAVNAGEDINVATVFQIVQIVDMLKTAAKYEKRNA